ncbi:MAG: hypothetical protein JEY96_03490 [Bacteroidales bacterium]|nr:hypothetical protein [Bacteroidales bacterium]
MKKIKILFTVYLLILTATMFANDSDSVDIYPKTKPIIKVFGNYHFGLNDYSTVNAFELTRAYLGYDVKVSENISFKTNIDMGRPTSDSKYDYVAYLKTAALKYHKGKIQINAGLIGLKQFKLQEKIWGHRYVYKSLQDEHKFGHSADLGVMLEYKLIDGLFIDATIRNGEGYKKLQSDETFNGALGITYHVWKNIVVRGSYEHSEKSINQSVYSGLIGFQMKDVILMGVEYNYMQNSSYIKNHNLTGYSAYLTFIMNDKFQLFGRYDNLKSNKINDEIISWNESNDGEAIIAGVQYKLEKNLKVSTNLQYWAPDKNSLNKEVYAFISLEYKL